MLFIFQMKGSTLAAANHQQPARFFDQAKAKLTKYDQQHFHWRRCIAHILAKPNSFFHQRKCQEQSELLEKYFSLQEADKQIHELAEYYRFYKISPTLAHLKYLEFMATYWNKKKSLYYRGIKKQLQIDDQASQGSAEKHIQQIVGKCCQSLWTGTFQLPSQLNPSEQAEQAQQNDPDATIRRLLAAMSAQKQHKSTGQASEIVQFEHKWGKPQLKSQLKTNPSHLASTSEFSISRKKMQHKSMQSEAKTSMSKKLRQKLNPSASCQRLGPNKPQLQLNYQRRNKQKEGNKHSNKKRLSKAKYSPHIHKKEPILKKARSLEKIFHCKSDSKSKPLQTSADIKVAIDRAKEKVKEMQTTAEVKAAISRVKDKIKAQKSAMMKKYIQSRQSRKSNDSGCRETTKRNLN